MTLTAFVLVKESIPNAEHSVTVMVTELIAFVVEAFKCGAGSAYTNVTAQRAMRVVWRRSPIVTYIYTELRGD
jgi:hypothetical protein